jgi:hypothetical protein
MIILSRVSVTKTRVWIGESVYWMFTSRSYNYFLDSQDYCNFSICNVSRTLNLLILPLELGNSSEINSHSRILSYPYGTAHSQKTQFHCCLEQNAQITSHVINISPAHWLAACCPATSYKHLCYCCVLVLRGVSLPSNALPYHSSYRHFIKQYYLILFYTYI